jgi:hypothetical protein
MIELFYVNLNILEQDDRTFIESQALAVGEY